VSLAFVLPEGAVGNGPMTFPGFPGVWTPGEAIEAQAFVALGAFESVEAMSAAVAELGLPLEEKSVKKGSAPLPVAENHFGFAPEEAEAATSEEEPEPPAEEAEA